MFFRRRKSRTGDIPEEELRDSSSTSQPLREMLDPEHSRASVDDGQQLLIDPLQVLDNITDALRRFERDITTSISIDEVLPVEHLLALVAEMMLGPTLIVHTINTGYDIMAERYPAIIVAAPLPPKHDVRTTTPLNVSDNAYGIAKTLFNNRGTTRVELREHDVRSQIQSLDPVEQISVFITLMYLYGAKVATMKKAVSNFRKGSSRKKT